MRGAFGARCGGALESSLNPGHIGCNFFGLAVFCLLETAGETDMNSNLIPTDGMVIDGWSALIAFALYLIALGVFAITLASGISVA